MRENGALTTPDPVPGHSLMFHGAFNYCLLCHCRHLSLQIDGIITTQAEIHSAVFPSAPPISCPACTAFSLKSLPISLAGLPSISLHFQPLNFQGYWFGYMMASIQPCLSPFHQGCSIRDSKASFHTGGLLEYETGTLLLFPTSISVTSDCSRRTCPSV